MAGTDDRAQLGWPLRLGLEHGPLMLVDRGDGIVAGGHEEHRRGDVSDRGDGAGVRLRRRQRRDGSDSGARAAASTAAPPPMEWPDRPSALASTASARPASPPPASATTQSSAESRSSANAA